MEPLDFLRTTLPELFNRGVSALSDLTASGDAKAKARLDDIRAASGTLHFVLEGEGEIFLAVHDGRMDAHDAAPASPIVRMSYGIPSEAARAALGELERSGALSHEKAAVRVASVASARVEKLLAQEKHAFHVVLEDTPDLDDVTIKVGIGHADPPETPGFTAKVKWDDIEATRARKMTPMQLLMGGKVRLVGDASRLMTVVMTLMQTR